MKIEINIILFIAVTMLSGIGCFVTLMAVGLFPNMIIGG